MIVAVCVSRPLAVAQAEQNAAPDRGGITAFRSSTALRPPRQVSLAFGRLQLVSQRDVAESNFRTVGSEPTSADSVR